MDAETKQLADILNGNPATSKSQFVLGVVKAYVAKYPKKTFAELEQAFPVSLCSKGYKFIGLLCPEDRHKSWDNKYYKTDSSLEGVPLYKQFTYARNAIQFNIDQYYIKHKDNPNAIRYRDDETEGYNITPNFFIRPKIESDNLDFDTPSFSPTDSLPKPNKHFEDRLFDRDTLLLREYSINLIFLIAAYGSYEDHWATTLRREIREDMVKFLNDNYTFFRIEPMEIPLYSQNGQVASFPFMRYFHSILAGKAYKESEDSKEIILAFEKNTAQGKADYAEVRDEIKSAIRSGSIDEPKELKP